MPDFSEWAFVALGANLGDPRAQIVAALDCLRSLSTVPLRRSSLWQSTPVDCPAGSPLFVNAVAGLLPPPGTTPESLLAALQALEVRFGRRPKAVLNEPRPLDLDLIAFGREVRHTRALVLPHPRAAQRRFVLQPLAEIAPGLVLPGQTQPALRLLEALRSEEILTRCPLPGAARES
jgi:2-amino-4-hydroxy-6-hydroxymethyldihydropteridine diphosphokinase